MYFACALLSENSQWSHVRVQVRSGPALQGGSSSDSSVTTVTSSGVNRYVLYHSWFSEMDSDSDGSITREELAQVMQRVLDRVVPSPIVDKIFARMDKDGSGLVDYSEFLRVVKQLKHA